jgi:hypothetical protein
MSAATTTTRSAFGNTLPMVPLSAQLPKQLVASHHSASSSSCDVTSTASAAMINGGTSLEIRIVTTEQVPKPMCPSGTTTTVERELKLCLSLPAAFAAKELKSLNVQLCHNPAPTPPTSPVSTANGFFAPSHQQQQQCNNNNHKTQGFSPEFLPHYYASQALQQQQQRQQKQKQLNQQESLPEAVSSSSQTSVPLPETVSSSSFASQSTKKRRRTKRNQNKNEATATTTQSSSRKKRRTQ